MGYQFRHFHGKDPSHIVDLYLHKIEELGNKFNWTDSDYMLVIVTHLKAKLGRHVEEYNLSTVTWKELKRRFITQSRDKDKFKIILKYLKLTLNHLLIYENRNIRHCLMSSNINCNKSTILKSIKNRLHQFIKSYPLKIEKSSYFKRRNSVKPHNFDSFQYKSSPPTTDQAINLTFDFKEQDIINNKFLNIQKKKCFTIYEDPNSIVENKLKVNKYIEEYTTQTSNKENEPVQENIRQSNTLEYSFTGLFI